MSKWTVPKKYKPIDSYDPTYSVWVQLLTYGRGRASYGLPELELEPAISGLAKSDAQMWALGQAQVMLRNADWSIIRNDIAEDKAENTILVEEKSGARYSISVVLDTVQPDGTVVERPIHRASVNAGRKPRGRKQ